jgi:hypothetical protein
MQHCAKEAPCRSFEVVKRELDGKHAASLLKSDAILGHVASWGDRFPHLPS